MLKHLGCHEHLLPHTLYLNQKIPDRRHGPPERHDPFRPRSENLGAGPELQGARPGQSLRRRWQFLCLVRGGESRLDDHRQCPARGRPFAGAAGGKSTFEPGAADAGRRRLNHRMRCHSAVPTNIPTGCPGKLHGKTSGFSLNARSNSTTPRSAASARLNIRWSPATIEGRRSGLIDGGAEIVEGAVDGRRHGRAVVDAGANLQRLTEIRPALFDVARQALSDEKGGAGRRRLCSRRRPTPSHPRS